MIVNVFGIIYSFVLYMLFLIGSGNKFETLYPICLVLLLVYIFLFYLSGLRENPKLYNWGIRPTYLCLLGILVVNLQFFADVSFGFSRLMQSMPLPWAENYSDKCFFGGMLFVVIFILTNYNCKTCWRSKNQRSITLNVWPWLIFMLLSFSVFLAKIDISSFINGSVYSGSGASDFKENISNSMERMFNVFLIIVLAVYTKKKLNKKETVTIKQFFKEMPSLFWVLVIAYILLRLLSGDRGPVMYSSLSVLFSMLMVTHKTINMKRSILIIVAGAFTVTLLGVVRGRAFSLTYGEKIEESLKRLREINKERVKTVSTYTRELAGSMKCNFICVRDIEEGRTGYSFGRYTFLSAIGSFPGAKKKYFEYFGFKKSEMDSADYITQSYNGSASYDVGLGSSVFGESYLELGVIGIIITAAILGIVFKKVDLSYLNSGELSIPVLIAVFKLSSVAFYVSRSSFSYTLSQVLYIWVIYFILNLIVKPLFYRKTKQ